METLLVIGSQILNVGMALWLVLQRPTVQHTLKMLLGSAVVRMNEERQDRARRAARIGIDVLKTMKLNLPTLFDDPSFQWDEVGLVILDAIEKAGQLDEDVKAADPVLVRDYVLEALIAEDLTSQHVV